MTISNDYSNTSGAFVMDRKQRRRDGLMKMWRRLYGDVFDGSMAGRKDALVLFMYLISRADDSGFVRRPSLRVVGACTGLTPEEHAKAIEELEAPDPDSRSKAHEGRRILKEDDGWLIVNFSHYQGIQREDQRRESVRKAVSKYRSKDITVSNGVITPDYTPLEERRGEEKKGEEINQQTLPYASSMRRGVGLRRKALENGEQLPEGEITADQAFDEIFWPEYPRKKDKEPARKAWKALKLKDTDEAQILAIMKALRHDVKEEWRDRTPDKIPYGATWLHRKGWLDG